MYVEQERVTRRVYNGEVLGQQGRGIPRVRWRDVERYMNKSGVE